MTGSSSDDYDEKLPHPIVVDRAVSPGPATAANTQSNHPSTSTVSSTSYTYVPVGSQQQQQQQQSQTSFSSHQILPVPRFQQPQGDGPGTSTTAGDVDFAPPTAAMSVASLDDEPKSAARMERENFLLFIKILFKVLEEENDASIRTKAQRIVMECRRRNQQGDPNFTPLMYGIERHLRVFVGEAKWRRSHLLLHHYITTRRGMHGSSSSAAGNGTNRERPTAILVGK